MHNVLLIAFIFVNVIHQTIPGLPETIKIGAIIKPGEEDLELAFKHAVWINNIALQGSKIEAHIENVDLSDSLSTAHAACRLLDSGVWAIVYPYSGVNVWIIKSITDRLGVPLLHTAPDYPYMIKSFVHQPYKPNYTISLYPDLKKINKAVFDYVDYNREWRSFSLIFDSHENLIKIKDSLAMSTYDTDLQIKIREFKFARSDPPETLFKSIMKRRDSNFIVSVDKENYPTILEKLRTFSLVDFYCSYLFYDLDLQFWNLSAPDLIAFNITGFRMFNPFDERIKIRYNAQEWKTGRYEASSENVRLTLDLALVYDAVALFTRSLIGLSELTDQLNGPSVSCSLNDTWVLGKPLLNQMKKVGVTGLTGHLIFDDEGLREKIVLSIIRLKEGQWSEIGSWNSDSGVNITSEVQAEEKSAIDYLKTTKLKLIVVENVPYVMKKPDYANLTGDEFDKYEGFCIDLLRQIQEELGISGYDLTIYPGKSYGSKDKKNGTWSGLIGEMLEKNHDLATTDLTITHERQTGVDFTIPFITLGISILYSKPAAAPLNLWAFLDPFSLEVWLYVATAFIGVSLLMYIVARISPYEWLNDHPCDDEPEELTTQFSIGNCLWFSLGSIMQQGSDLAPKSISTRVMASAWSFFTLIMVSSYTANLAAFLTVARMDAPIENAEGLAMQSKVAYGCSKAGSTRKFFQNSTYTIYQRMYAYMESAEPPVYAESNSDGVRRVLKGNYAFLMESLSILYNVNRYCNLTQVGDLLDQKGYGIAMRPGSPFRTIFSNEILRLQEQGRIDALRKTWFEDYPTEIRALENPEEAACPPEILDEETSALDVANVGGVFIVLLCGIAIGTMFVIIEFVWKAKKVSRHEREHTIRMMTRTLCDICRGRNTSAHNWRKKSTSDGTQSISTETASRNNRVNGVSRQQSRVMLDPNARQIDDL
ncbi:glutamate receptor ionotropic, kainate 2 [Tetranychus urticae]|uniref:Ionotropic glutamate receptor C-terminal domain-containing protein n=1 Tax=Tetranychus urticae TaxID=32264 RepID=T1K9M1_TETUR|nr:glutamate receptor ionotropic, kainate 2 [Tetranychus urticae]